MARCRAVVAIPFVLILTARSMPAAAEPPPAETKHVLLVRQAPTGEPSHATFDEAFAEGLRGADSVPIELYEESIDSERFPGANQSQLVTTYLTRKYADQRIDVIVAPDDRTLRFARQTRPLLGNPPIVTSVTASTSIDPADGVVGLQGGFWITGTIDLARTLLPDTRCVAVVDGTRDNNGDVESEVRRQWQSERHGADLVYLRDLPLTDVITRLGALDPRCIVLFVRQTILTRSQGIDELDGLAQVVAASSAPVFSYREPFLGHGIVGGHIWRSDADARRLGQMARRIVNGTPPRNIAGGRNSYADMIDWNQLEHWQIPVSRVPSRAVVLFRPPSFLQMYRGYVIAGVLIFFAQLALILGLLTERAYRRRAERDAQRTRDQLAHLTRVSAMGELAASLAHELKQPLSAILANARAAAHLLEARRDVPTEVRHILEEIVEDDKRAGDVLSRVRELIINRPSEHSPLDMNDIVRGVMKLVTTDSIIRNVPIETDLALEPVPVEGDRVQLQQVVLNLLLNALDAAASANHVGGRVRVQTEQNGDRDIHLVVRDNGPGLAAGAEQSAFEPFYTTKHSGIGMGLSIARSIVHAHGGHIWAANHPLGGAEFHVTLPRAIGHPATAPQTRDPSRPPQSLAGAREMS